MARAVAPPLVLASASPRRRELLDRLGLAFEVVPPPPGVEPGWRGEEPERYAREVAWAKARSVAAREPEPLVLAADTIVVLDGDVLGKPADPAEARRMLARLSGREHRVLTALALRAPEGRSASGLESTTVGFRTLAEDEIADYVATGEPLDKAGAYGIQAYGATLVAVVRGCYFNVMGLPVARLLALLSEVGWEYRAPGVLRPARQPA